MLVRHHVGAMVLPCLCQCVPCAQVVLSSRVHVTLADVSGDIAWELPLS